MMKRQDGTFSRTQILNLIGVVAGAVLTTLPSLQASIPEVWYGAAFMAFSVANAVIRATQTKV